mmetsp:Transcript_30685/g.77342  ORF Transcript_30685/g.77342 Transcript_30685/m.77342 type:complete len:270 (+) Transcript_30685:192-1001(+)|eukprot:CAMPEP_0173435964 /NCGR_PEP_ID=MMETSP1357-20121228/15686_1 /TAXON_ID=77926 /ORGANISM="Hemiselmis rufescens, Strain PCC563" /LENGTH=269 /DNA_ID=CAMNT_0014401005 /DNA_START=189 /DNA_END=995 /DNA_ORIENTATION=+
MHQTASSLLAHAAVAAATLSSASAFVPTHPSPGAVGFAPGLAAPLRPSCSLRPAAQAQGVVMMAGGFGKGGDTKEGPNRDQRRAAKKNAAKKGKGSAAAGQQQASEVLASSIQGEDYGPLGRSAGGGGVGKVDRPSALESLRSESDRRREEALRQANAGKISGLTQKMQPKPGLPLEDEVAQIPVEVLKTVENSLLYGVLAVGALWVLAGLGTAYDAYMIATKQPVPAGLDEFLGKYVEPFLTPGLGVVLLFSVMLGGLQFYKFEGGRK